MHRVGELADAMRWPRELDAARLDGDLRLAIAPILTALVTDLSRLKALMAGLLGEERRPVPLDRVGPSGEVSPGDDLPSFRPGRPVTVDGDGEPVFAATNPFDALARRTLDLLLPEMEQALGELTILVHEYGWDQDFRLVELVETLPGDLLAALEAQRPSWDDQAAARDAELERLGGHLARWRTAAGAPDDATADLRRALGRAIARSGDGAEPGGGPATAVRDAASATIEPLRRFLAALDRESAR